jgi:alpha-glucosidase (family GH31 glycosyl hydrolase)
MALAFRKKKEKRPARYDFETAPVANKDAIVSGKQYRFTVLTDGLLRFEWAEDGKFEDRASTFAVKRQMPVPKFFVWDHKNSTFIATKRFELSYDKKRFSKDGLIIRLKSEFEANANVKGDGIWRYGDGIDDLGGTIRTLDWANGRVGMGHGILSMGGFGLIDDSSSFCFTDDGWVDVRKKGDRIDGYIFCYGHDYREALRAYYAVSGSQPLLPRYALGNWWCRYHKYTADEYLEVMDHFERDDVPFAISIIDLYWHLVDMPPGWGSGWGGYNWNKDLIPDPKKFLKTLHDKGYKVTLNDHPSDGIRWFDMCWEAVCKKLGIDPDSRKQIEFDSVDRDFMDAYFDIAHHEFEDDYGVDFWWVDWQQGEHSRIPEIDPLWMLNHYHFLDNTREKKRPLILSRFAGPGSQRYQVGFSGDVVMTWPSLNFQPEFTATASNIGYGWWSHDIGGHMHGYKDDELTTRWYQVGCWSPIFRLHCDNNTFNFREPWKFNAEACMVMEETLRLRHRLVPYLYTMNARSAAYDEPLIQPMYWEYPEAKEAYEYRKQYFYGSQLLVCPITHPRDAETHLGAMNMWLPAGRWIDIFAGLIYDGDRELSVHRPLSQTPALAQEGAIIPFDGTNPIPNGAPNPKTIELVIIVGKDGHFELIEDDGTGSRVDEMDFAIIEKDDDGEDDGKQPGPGHENAVRFVTTNITFNQAEGIVTIGAATPSSKAIPEVRSWIIRLVSHTSTTASSVTATSGGNAVDASVSILTEPPAFRTLPLHTAQSTLIHIPSVPTSSTLSIVLGQPNPQLDVLDATKRAFDILYDSKGGYDFRQDVWWTINDSGIPVKERCRRLREKGIREEILNALLEGLEADGRFQ